MKKATIKDVAREAGVSMSTVNKALTGKSGISKELKEKVLKTVDRLGYTRNTVAGSLARNPIRIGIIIPSDWEDYYNDICNGISYEIDCLVEWKLEGVTLEYSVKDDDSEKQVYECFRKLNADGIKAVIFCHANYSEYSAALNYAADCGIKVICIGKGAPNSEPYFSAIEVDAYKCGRIAAELLENCVKPNGNVAVIIGSNAIWPHSEKLRGFKARAAEGKKLVVAGSAESYDDDEKAYALTSRLIAEKDICGIFIATGAAEGVCRAVEESKKEIKIITTDMGVACRRYIEKGMVAATIYQNTFFQGVEAVSMLYEFFTSGKRPPEELLIPPAVYTKESLPENGNKMLYVK